VPAKPPVVDETTPTEENKPPVAGEVLPAEGTKQPSVGSGPVKPSSPAQPKVKQETVPVYGIKADLLRYDATKAVQLPESMKESRRYLDKLFEEVKKDIAYNPVAARSKDMSDEDFEREKLRAAKATQLRNEITALEVKTNQAEVDARYAATQFKIVNEKQIPTVDAYFGQFPDDIKKLVDTNLNLKVDIKDDMQLMWTLPKSDDGKYDLEVFGKKITIERFKAAKSGEFTSEDQKQAEAYWDHLNVVQKRITVSNYIIDQYHTTAVMKAKETGYEKTNNYVAMVPGTSWNIPVLNIPMHNLNPAQIWRGNNKIPLRDDLNAALADVRQYNQNGSEGWWANKDASDAYSKLSATLTRVSEQTNAEGEYELPDKLRQTVIAYQKGAQAQAYLIRMNIETAEGGQFAKQWDALDHLVGVELPSRVNRNIDRINAFKPTGLLHLGSKAVGKDGKKWESEEKEPARMFNLADATQSGVAVQRIQVLITYSDDKNGIEKIKVKEMNNSSADGEYEISGNALDKNTVAGLVSFDHTAPSDKTNTLKLMEQLKEVVQKARSTRSSVIGQGLLTNVQMSEGIIFSPQNETQTLLANGSHGLPLAQQLQSAKRNDIA